MNSDELPETATSCDVGAPVADVETLSKDVVFEILKNQRRRDALRFLKANDGATTLSDMAEHIAAKENGIAVRELSSRQRKRVYIGLYQCHLPKMASTGVIDFDKNRGTIALAAPATQLDAFLEGTPSANVEGGNPGLNLAVAAGVAGSVSAGLLGVPGFDVLSAGAWAVVSTLVLMGMATLETFRYRPE
jgi:hypothetical protein